MRKDQIKLSQVLNIPNLVFAGTFDSHMKWGDQSGQSHSGLHLLSEFRKDNRQPLNQADITANAAFTGRLNNRQTTLTVVEVDTRTRTFSADVNIYGQAKRSTFFPIGTTLVQAKQFVRDAWKNHCTYGSTSYGGGDVDVYKQMRAKFGLNWVGMVTINGQDVWVGSAYSGAVVTAFPAVKNKFAR